MRPSVLIAVALLVIPSHGGCRWYKSRTDCSTDARGLMLTCAGEEAVRRCPCGPDVAYYGHRPTTWSVWPAGWDQYATPPCVEACEQSCEEGCQDESGSPELATPHLVAEPYLGETVSPVVTETAPVEESIAPPPSTPLNLPPLEPNGEAEVDQPEPELIEPEEPVPPPPSTPLDLPPPADAQRNVLFDSLERDPLGGAVLPDEEPDEAAAEADTPESPYLGLFTP